MITVTQQLDGGWWEGNLNGIIGWFPSNYVTHISDSNDQIIQDLDNSLLIHLQNFQKEIIQHVLEGELRQVTELAQLLSIFMINLEPLTNLSFLNKLIHLRDLLSQAINMHQHLASALDEMKNSVGPKCMGKLFLDFASSVNAIGCDYSKIHLHVVTGLEKHTATVTRHFASFGINFQLPRCKQQLSLVFERLGRYPLLLKEMERYLEEPHVDRDDILRAMHIYGEITERCAILRKFKEFDIDVLLSTINDWQGPPIQQLGDPILTLRVLLVNVDMDSHCIASDFLCTESLVNKTQQSVLVIFPSCVLLLARTNQPDVYEFTAKIPLNRLTVLGSTETETDLHLLVSASNQNHASVNLDNSKLCRILLACTDQNARDLLVSTLTDLIQYQIQNDQISLNETKLTENDQIDSVISSNSDPTTLFTNFNPNEVCKSKTAPHTTQNVELYSISKQTNVNQLTDSKNQRSTLFDVPQPSCSHDSSESNIIRQKETKTARPLTEPSVHSSSGEGEQNSETRLTDMNIEQHIQPIHEPNLSGITKPEEVNTMDTVSIGTLSPSTNLQFLPHKITSHAHVHWLESNRGTNLNIDNSDNLNSVLTRGIRSLRLDGPMDFTREDHSSSVTGLNNIHHVDADNLITNYPHRNHNNNMDSCNPNSSTDISLFSSAIQPTGLLIRPHSPKGGEYSKESRRKRADRQKSAINVEDVLRSVGKIHELERRTMDDAKILQVIEAYCASSWIQHSCRSLEASQNDSRLGSTIVSPTESKTLLQQFRHPKSKNNVLTTTATTHSGNFDVKFTHQGLLIDSVTKLSRQSLPQTILCSKPSFKRSDSKNKSRNLPNVMDTNSFDTNSATNNTTTITTMGSSSNSNSVLNKSSGHYKNLVETESDIIQSFSPPPVILPTHGGRRR